MKNGWPKKRIGEVAIIKPPKNEARDRISSDATVSFLPMEDLGIAEMYPEATQTRKLSDVVGSYTYFAEGDVLLAKITPCFENGKLGIARRLENGIGFGSSEFIVLRPHETLSKEWLYYFLSREDFRSDGAQRMGGAVGQQRVPKEFVESCAIPLPPLAEQQRIVGLLDEAMAGIATAQAHAETNLQNARALFESHLQSVFTHLGPGWMNRKLQSLCREITVGYVGPMKKEYTESGVTFLRSQNIRPFEVSLENALFISRGFDAKIAKSRLRPGDVAVVRTGYPGTAAVIPASLPESNCADLVIVRPGPDVHPQFLAAFFNSSYGKEHVAGKVVGAAQKHFNVGAAKETMLHLPPLEEQRTIVAKFDALAAETQRLATIYKRKLAALEALKKSLLHQAFTGQL